MVTKHRSRALFFAVSAFALSSAVLLDAVPMFAQAQSSTASEAATAIAKAKLEAATAAQNAGKKKYPVTRDDMVVAMPVDQAHLTIAHASRVWRKVCIPQLPFSFTPSVALLVPVHAWMCKPFTGPLHSLFCCGLLPIAAKALLEPVPGSGG